MSKLLITQTSDIHGFIYPTDYVLDKNWGMSKIYNKIENLNKEFNFKLNIDTGDFIQGSPLAFYMEYMYKHEKSKNIYIGELLDVANIDIFTLGNHEFNFGQNYLNKNLDTFLGDILCANIHNLNKNISPYKIYTFDNLKVGVIGLTTNYIPNWEKKENIQNLIFDNPVTTYAKYEKELKKSCDIIIVNYHGGLEKDLETNKKATELLNQENQGSELLDKFDSIDILLTGHQHREISTKINNTIVMQPSNNGQAFSKIIIDTTLKRIESHELIFLSENDFESKKINQYMNDSNINCNLFLDKVVTSIDCDLNVENVSLARFNGTPYTNFINSIFCKIMDTDISCVSLFDSAVGFSKELTIRQIILNYPFPNNLIKLNLTGTELIQVLEQNSNYYTLQDDEIIINPKYLTPKPKHFNYDIFYGVNFTINVYDTKNQITDVTINNAPIDLEKEYSICISNYRYTTLEEFPIYKNKEIIKESDKDVITLLTEYFISSKDLSFNSNINFNIIKK